MTTQRSEGLSGDRTGHQTTGALAPFPGTFIPGVCFETGYCFWVIEFTATPTEFDSYTEVWIITPDGDRVLYTDPEAATDEVLKYHEFDRTVGATTAREQSDPRSVRVSMTGDDGTELDLKLSLGQSVGTRALNAIIALTPEFFARSAFGTTISTLALNLLLDVNGMKVAGRTETGRRYRLDADRLQTISDATSTLDGSDLGELTPPGRSIGFGDAKTTDDALCLSGDLFLERDNPSDIDR